METWSNTQILTICRGSTWILIHHTTVPFRLIRPSRVTEPMVLAEFGHLSCVTTPMADDPKNGQKRLLKRYLQVWVILYVIRKLATLGSWPLIFCSCLCCTKYIKNYIIGKLENRSTEWEYLKNENCPQINPMNEWFLIFRYYSTFTVFTRCCLNMASFGCAEL